WPHLPESNIRTGGSRRRAGLKRKLHRRTAARSNERQVTGMKERRTRFESARHTRKAVLPNVLNEPNSDIGLSLAQKVRDGLKAEAGKVRLRRRRVRRLCQGRTSSTVAPERHGDFFLFALSEPVAGDGQGDHRRDMISNKARYALRSLIFLAERHPQPAS